MKRYFLNIAILVSGFNMLIIHAQDLNNILKTFPVAPNAFEFNKYGEIPVSKYTGVPNISIPIYTIDAGEGDLKIPITLTYHSNGFRVSEESGWTGLGWTLNEGGTITQIVNGYDDFKTTHPNRELPDMDAIIHHASNGGAPFNAFTLSKGSSGHQLTGIDTNHFSIPNLSGCTTPLYEVKPLVPPGLFGISEKIDYEPDIFNFSVLGYSGKFVLDWETETFKCLTDPKIKVSKLNNTHKKISITTPDGHIFMFSIKDESVDCYSDTSSCYGYDSGNGNENFLGVMSRVYKLDDIYTNKGRHISYSYTKTDLVRSFPLKTDWYQEDDSCWGCSISINTKTVNRVQTHSYVNKISFDDGLMSVDFDMSDRLDFIGTKKLDAIKIRKLGSSAATKTIKQFDFNYSYFVSSTPTSPNLTHKGLTEYTHRLRLDTVTETGKPSYVFSYNSRQLPVKTLMNKQDYWGYYTSFNNTGNYPNLYRFNYKLEQYDESIFNLGSGNNRSSRLEDTKAAILEKISYPTGGYTTFGFELNAFTNYIVPNFEDNVNTIYTPNRTSYGAGLRVNEIKNFDANHTLITKKTYSYSGGKLMTPIRFLNKVYMQSTANPNSPTNTYSGSGWRKKISASNYVTPSINGVGNFVGYGEVIEHFESNQEDSETIGSIKYIFENHNNKGEFISTNTALLTNGSFQYSGLYTELNMPLYFVGKQANGSLLEQWILDKNNNIKQKTINNYSYKRNPYSTFGVRLGQLNTRRVTAVIGGGNNGGHSTCYYERYTLGTYDIGGLYTLLDSTEEINYLNGKQVSTLTEFVYNDYLLPIEQTTQTSTGHIIRSTTSYTSQLPQYESNNFLTSILNSKAFKDDKLINNISNIYTSKDVPDDFPNSILPENYPWPLGYGQLHFKNKVIDHLKDKEVSIANTLNGAPLSITVSDDKTTYYVWGYNETKIIAKIDNYVIEGGTSSTDWTTHPQTGAILNAQSSSDYDNYSGTSSSENALMDKLNILRDAFPNAMVTTYTYNPLIGVTSITDPKGYTIYYEYDTFNRLEHVKDADGNILSKNEYNYKQ